MRTPSKTTILTSLTILQPALSSPSSSSSSSPPGQCATGNFPAPFNPNLTTCLDSTILQPRAWYPWTHRPHCVEAEDSPRCVFTRAGAHSGISVVTTPDEAAEALNPFRHNLHDDNSNPTTPASRRPYEVRDIPGKGKGAVATRRIAKGTAVLVDRAAVLAAVEYPAEVMREEVQELLALAAAQLPDPEAVQGLAKRGPSRSGSKKNRVDGGGDDEDDGGEEEEEAVEMSEMEDIMVTNTFAVPVGGKEYMALFPNLAVSLSDYPPYLLRFCFF